MYNAVDVGYVFGKTTPFFLAKQFTKYVLWIKAKLCSNKQVMTAFPPSCVKGIASGAQYGSHLVSHMHQLGDHAITACDGVRNRERRGERTPPLSF